MQDDLDRAGGTVGGHPERGLEFSIGRFMAIGLSFREAYATASAFAAFVLGSVQLNLGLDTADLEEQRMRRRLYEGLDPQRHPILVAHADELSRMDSRDEFELGLAALLDGIEARIASRRSRE